LTRGCLADQGSTCSRAGAGNGIESALSESRCGIGEATVLGAHVSIVADHSRCLALAIGSIAGAGVAGVSRVAWNGSKDAGGSSIDVGASIGGAQVAIVTDNGGGDASSVGSETALWVAWIRLVAGIQDKVADGVGTTAIARV